jgi:hypothetical protein
MTLSAILTYTSAELALVALIFFLIGFARSGWRIAPPPSRTTHDDGTEVARVRAIQRADWKCAAGLLGVAFVAYALKHYGTGAYFDEPSGNIAGGMLLVAVLVGLITIIALIARQLTLSRALRKLE